MTINFLRLFPTEFKFQSNLLHSPRTNILEKGMNLYLQLWVKKEQGRLGSVSLGDNQSEFKTTEKISNNHSTIFPKKLIYREKKRSCGNPWSPILKSIWNTPPTKKRKKNLQVKTLHLQFKHLSLWFLLEGENVQLQVVWMLKRPMLQQRCFKAIFKYSNSVFSTLSIYLLLPKTTKDIKGILQYEPWQRITYIRIHF